jgi:protein-tyrosine-phosphatase
LVIKLLFVCTAGRCRSPIAAALLEKRLGPVDAALSIASVGLKFTGEPTPEIGVSVMAEHGIDLAPHRSVSVTSEIVAEADLILGMTREHVRDVVGISPAAWPKTFTLKDFVRRADKVGPPRRHQRLADWLASVGEGRDPREVLGSDPDDEVPDPYGQRTKAWERVVDELDDLVSKIPRLLGVTTRFAPSTDSATRSRRSG